MKNWECLFSYLAVFLPPMYKISFGRICASFSSDCISVGRDCILFFRDWISWLVDNVRKEFRLSTVCMLSKYVAIVNDKIANIKPKCNFRGYNMLDIIQRANLDLRSR